MKRQTALIAALLAVVLLESYGSAAEPDRRGSSVVVSDATVRDVHVRDARVPSVPRRTTAMPRPFLPDVISRPDQGGFTPAAGDPAVVHSRRRGHHNQPAAVGYAVGFPIYPFVFEQPSSYNPPTYPATVAAPSYPVHPNTPALAAGSPSFAAIDCGLVPGTAAPCGGLTFDVSPADAQVSIEGLFVGTVDSFSSTLEPLVLSPGVHYVEVRRPGYRTETFDVSVDAGSILPYRGALEPLRTR